MPTIVKKVEEQASFNFNPFDDKYTTEEKVEEKEPEKVEIIKIDSEPKIIQEQNDQNEQHEKQEQNEPYE